MTGSHPAPPAPLTLTPIGVARSPFTRRQSAPRQPEAARGIEGRLELLPGRGFEDAITDLEGFSHLWVLYAFHLNEGWRPRVLPPRSTRRRGLFATRAPYRPNPIGLSVVELVRVEGLTLFVRNVDFLDGSPLLDVKPYLAYTDAIPAASAGWLGEEAEAEAAPVSALGGTDPAGAASADPGVGVPRDPGRLYRVEFSALAAEQLVWLGPEGEALRQAVAAALALGPQPHAYRRIRRVGAGLVLAHRAWRVHFTVAGKLVEVARLSSGYRPRELADPAATADERAAHVAFVARFGR